MGRWQMSDVPRIAKGFFIGPGSFQFVDCIGKSGDKVSAQYLIQMISGFVESELAQDAFDGLMGVSMGVITAGLEAFGGLVIP